MAQERYQQLYTPQNIAKILQLNVVTIYTFIKNKELPAVKIGRNYRIAKNDLDTFIKSNKTY